MARYIIIIVLGGMFTFGINNITLNRVANFGTQNAVDKFSLMRAHDIASSMADILLMRIANDVKYRDNTEVTEQLYGGEVTYRVEDTFFKSDSLIKISVTGNFLGAVKNVVTYTMNPSQGWVPNVVRAAWTANGPLNKTISDMYIDGRNYDLNGNIIPKTGVFGVSTSTIFENFENGSIGGTKDSVDYPMTFPEDPNVIEENYNWGGTFPTSPDEILGYPEGTLKAYSQSGENGSLYTTNVDDLKDRMLSGVTYLEIPPGQEEKIQLQDGIHRGLLIIHNQWTNSRIKQTKIANGRFEGIIVGDYMFHFHIDVLGSIILLSSDLETGKDCVGNLDHKVFYSSEAIRNAVGDVAGTLGAPPLYGFAKKRLKVKHWYE